MKVHTILLGLCALTLAAVIGATAISRHQDTSAPTKDANQIFQVKGQVRGFETDGTIRIAHEDIPGFMPAMEMPFAVKDPAVLRGLTAGDRVSFELMVTKEDSWISQIQKTGEASSSPEGPSPAPSIGTEPEPLNPGQEVPDFTLMDQHGRRIRLQDFRGKAVVLTFIYTRCPLPNFCPLMSKNFASLQERFTKEFPNKAQLLSVSFDPQFDTPETLSRYAALFQNGDKNWLFATGTPGEVDKVTELFGLRREPANGFINHDLRTALISPQGKLVHIWRSNVWTPYEVQRMVRETLQPTVAAR